MHDKTARAALFRTRLQEAMMRTGMTAGALARASGIDRSTLGQLLADDGARLPNGQTLAELARELRVSSDWLLGLAGAPQMASDVLEGSMTIAERSRTPLDENVFRWWQEAAGSKIRYVPTGLPDPLKTDRVLEHEFDHATGKTPSQAIFDARQKLAYARLPETDLEICMSVQTLSSFVGGVDVWDGLAAPAREEQRAQMAGILDELYPTLRLYLFDARRTYSAPYTVFGSRRAALYVGQMFFVFNTTQHVRALASHFDRLVREAVVQADAAADWLRQQRV